MTQHQWNIVLFSTTLYTLFPLIMVSIVEFLETYFVKPKYGRLLRNKSTIIGPHKSGLIQPHKSNFEQTLNKLQRGVDLR